MNFLSTICCLCTVVYCCNGSCWKIPPQSPMTGHNAMYRPCYNGQELIPRGTSVTRNCISCYCGDYGLLSCCTVGTKVRHYPDDCKKKISDDGCYEHAVRISDETSICTQGVGMIGR